jgi:Ca2+/H+ antiporter
MLLVFACGVSLFPIFLGVDQVRIDDPSADGGTAAALGLAQQQEDRVLGYSRFASIGQLCMYGFFLYFQLRTHKHMYDDKEDDAQSEAYSLLPLFPISRVNGVSAAGAGALVQPTRYDPFVRLRLV